MCAKSHGVLNALPKSSTYRQCRQRHTHGPGMELFVSLVTGYWFHSVSSFKHSCFHLDFVDVVFFGGEICEKLVPADSCS